MIFTLFSICVIFVFPLWSQNPNFGGDWHITYNDFLEERRSVPQLWDMSENFGNPIGARTNLAILDLIQAQFYAKTGLGFEITEILFWFIPFLAIGYIGIYLLTKRVTGSNIAGLISGFFFIINTYTLVLFSEAGHINILVAYSLFPLLILGYLRLESNRSLFSALLLSLVFSVQFLYDIRLSFISLIVLLILFFKSYLTLKNTEFRKLSICLTLGSVVFVLINSYFFVSILFGGIGTLPASQLSIDWVRKLSFQSIENGFSGMHPFWSTKGVTYFIKNSTYLVFFTLPAIIVAGLLLARKSPFKSMWPFLLLWVIGTFLISGTNSELGNLYENLFLNLPGFTMFREPQKFYVLVLTGFSVLIGFGFYSMYKKLGKIEKNPVVWKTLFTLVFIFVLTLINFPAYSKKISGNMRDSEIPNYSSEINKLISQNPGYYRILWIPQVTSSSYRTNQNPRIDASTFIETIYPEIVEETNSYDLLLHPITKKFLKTGSVRYVVFVFDDEFTKWHNYDFRAMAESFEKVSGYSKIIGENYVIFENKDYDHLISTTQNPLMIDKLIYQRDILIDRFAKFNPIKFSEETRAENEKFSKLFDISNVDSLDPIPDNGRLRFKSNILSTDIYKVEWLTSQNPYYFVSLDKDGTVKLTSINTRIIHNGNNFTLNDNITFLAETNIPISSDKNYLVEIGEYKMVFDYTEIIGNEKNGPIYFDPSSDNVSIYENNKEKYLLDNFEDKSNIEIGNCNNFQNRSLLETGISGLSVVEELTGNTFLKLQADEDIGCYSNGFFPNDKDELIYLELSYKNVLGEIPKICIYDNDSQKCILEEVYVDADTINWKRAESIINNEEYKNLSLFLYSNALERRTINLFDDLLIEGYRKISTTKAHLTEATPVSADIKMFSRKEGMSFEFTHDLIHRKQLPNASFDHLENVGKEAKDCNNIDKSELSQNGIYASQVVDDLEKGYYLELGGNKHVACYSIPVGRLDSNFEYIVSIKYAVAENSSARYCLLNSITQECELLKSLDKSEDWKSTSETFIPKHNDSYELYLYVYANKDVDSTSYSGQFDDISLVQVPKNLVGNYFLFSEAQSNFFVPQIEYNLVSPTNIRITATSVNGPFILNLNQNRSDRWNLQAGSDVDVQRLSSTSERNSWIVNSNSSEVIMNLEFKFQDKFILAMKVSAVTLILSILFCLMSLIIKLIKKLGAKK